MITVIIGLMIHAVAAPMTPAGATTNTTAATTSTAKPSNEGARQEQNFEDLLVQGKYHFSDEAVTTVEEDKVLDSLLGLRQDFKDRMENSAGRY